MTAPMISDANILHNNRIQDYIEEYIKAESPPRLCGPT